MTKRKCVMSPMPPSYPRLTASGRIQHRSCPSYGPEVRFCDHLWRYRAHPRWQVVGPPAECSLILKTDITYESLAKAFGQELEYHEETLYRMTETSEARAWASLRNREQISARHRMALFPNKAEVIFASPDIWTVRVSCYYIDFEI